MTKAKTKCDANGPCDKFRPTVLRITTEHTKESIIVDSDHCPHCGVKFTEFLPSATPCIAPKDSMVKLK